MKVTEVLWKDVIEEQRSYIHFIQKLSETYETLLNKSKFFRPFSQKIFRNVPGFKLLMESDEDALFKGFFFAFVYKDFVLRELI